MADKNGLILMAPTSVDTTGAGSTATISANGSVTFTTCTGISLNGVFTSTYDNYMIVCRYTGSSVTGTNLRLRSAGTDSTSTADYNYQMLFVAGTSITPQRVTTAGYWEFGSNYSVFRSGLVANIYGPYLSQPTAYRCCSVNDNGNANIYDFAGTHELSSSYDGFTWFTGGAPTLTGLMAVYGLRN